MASSHTNDVFKLRYMGSVSVNASMKKLDFNIRSFLAKECIERVCEQANMVSASTKRNKSGSREWPKAVLDWFGNKPSRDADKMLKSFLPGDPNMENGGKDVTLTISSQNFVVSLTSELKILFDHPVSNISFASGGDEKTADFIGYIAKDEVNGRRCYVFECEVGHASDVILAIGEAFKKRNDEVVSMPITTVRTPGVFGHDAAAAPVAPEPPKRNGHLCQPTPPQDAPSRVVLAGPSQPRSPPLIDFGTTPPQNGFPGHSYVNTSTMPGACGTATISAVSLALPCTVHLDREYWFHGNMSRDDSETLIKNDGEFLVRISAKGPNQVVLTGMQNGIHKHLMLIDDDGKVRMKDRVFESIRHLIEYHRNNRLPITSAESSLHLETPILRKQ